MPGLRWFGRFKGAAEILSLGNALSRRGYLLVERDDNPACRWCSEQLWFRAGPSGSKTVYRSILGAGRRRARPLLAEGEEKSTT